MFQRLLCFVALCVWLSASADPPPGYYNSAEGKTGPALRQALHAIISPHRVIPYAGTAPTNTARALMILDEDPTNTNNVILIYSRRSEAKTNFALPIGWNREHLWPNSYGIDSRLPAYSDLFNLRPEDATVNSARGNKFFDQSNTNDPAYRRPAHPEAPLASTDSNSWEPPDEVQGDIARSIFYMAVRYTGRPTNEAALFLTDVLLQISSATNLMGRLSTLLQWHLNDPVDENERRRNDLIYLYYQFNRNPFVDRPEWVGAAFNPGLLIIRDGTILRLRWPAEFVGAEVESLDLPNGIWEVIPLTPILLNGFWEALATLTPQSRFFRLHLH
jgi:endonuclease I